MLSHDNTRTTACDGPRTTGEVSIYIPFNILLSIFIRYLDIDLSTAATVRFLHPNSRNICISGFGSNATSVERRRGEALSSFAAS